MQMQLDSYILGKSPPTLWIKVHLRSGRKMEGTVSQLDGQAELLVSDSMIGDYTAKSDQRVRTSEGNHKHQSISPSISLTD